MRFLAPDPMGRVAVKRLKFCVTSSISHLIIPGLESRQELKASRLSQPGLGDVIKTIIAWAIWDLAGKYNLNLNQNLFIILNLPTIHAKTTRDVVSYYKRIDSNNKCLLLSLCQRIMKFIIQTKLPQLCPLVANITCEILTSFTNPCWYILPL